MKLKFIVAMLVLALAGAAVAIFQIKSADNKAAATVPTAETAAAPAMAKQVLELTAKNGYSPSVITAKAGVPIMLKVKTDDTQDCCTAFTIPSFGVQTLLPATGVTEIELPAQKAGETIEGSCQMGMDKFTIEVK